MERCVVCKQKDHEWFSAKKDGGMSYQERELWGDAINSLWAKSRGRFRDFLWGWMWDITPL